jgi:hypothetical protein
MHLRPFALLLLTLPTLAEAKPAVVNLPDELTLSGSNIIELMIEGRRLRFEVRANAPEAVTLNPAVAIAMQFKPGTYRSAEWIGPERVRSNSAVMKVDFGRPSKRRVFWSERPVSTIADGVINPAALPYNRVVFELAPVSGVEQVIALPLHRLGYLRRGGIVARLPIAEQNTAIELSFALNRELSLVTAPTGNWLARFRGASFVGPARDTVIYYDIARSVRPMLLADPLLLGSRRLADIAVRVDDYGDANGIAQSGEAEAHGGSEQIVVTADRKEKVDLRLTLGRNALGGCSRLTFDFSKNEALLACSAAA